MIAKITILTSFLFACVYPLCFWISVKEPLKNNFHRFHLGLPCVVGGIVGLSVLMMDVAASVKFFTAVWISSLLIISGHYWNKEFPRVVIISLPSIMGLFAFFELQGGWMPLTYASLLSWLLGGFILCSSLFAMNLGHWYLNVPGLPIKHLNRTTRSLIVFLILRSLWDIAFLSGGNLIYREDSIPIREFIFKLDGFLIWVALLFGTVFPLIGCWFAMGTLKLKNTQATTGILYVILCSILLGDLTYKYYAIKFGVML